MIGKFKISAFSSYLKEVVVRFPVSILCCLIAVGLWILLIANDGNEKNYFPYIIGSSIGLVYTLAIHLAFESKIVLNKIKIPVWTITISGLIFYSLYLEGVFDKNGPSYCVFFGMLGLAVTGVLLVSLAPIYAKKDNERYLLFNRRLFTSYLLSAAYTFVLLIGVVLAVLALDKLFGVNVDAKVYGYIAVVFIGLFFTTYFLASIPSPNEEINANPSKGLKILAQYILVPVVALYSLIILAYSIKNIFSPDLSETWTQELIWWFYVAGYFTFLLNLAVEVPDSLSSFGRFGKGFLFILIPMTLLVILSIGINMNAEGITELKYIVASISLYLLIISIYLLTNTKKDYRVVSGLLILFTLMAAFGPVSACRTSIRNQEKKLYNILEKHKVIQSGRLVEDKAVEISEEDLNTVKTRMDFLNSRRDEFILELESGPVTHNQLVKILGERIIPETKNFYIPFKILTEIPLNNYDFYIAFQEYHDKTLTGKYLQLSSDQQKLEWKDKDKVIKSYDLQKLLPPLLEADPEMQNRKIMLDNSDVQLDFYVTELNYHYLGDEFIVDYIRGFGLLSMK